MTKQELQNLIHNKPEAPIYIASGFFNDSQNQLLTELEKLLDQQGKNYISPRKEGVVDPKSPMRHVLMDEIFRQNVHSIDISGRCYFILDTSLGAFDLGTTWELGYAIGKYLEDSKSLNELIIYTPSDEVNFMFNTIKDNLAELYSKLSSAEPTSIKEPEALLLTKDNVVDFDTTKSLTNYSMIQHNLNALLQVTSFLSVEIPKRKVVACIDNRPMQISVLLGLLYSLKVPYYTCSFKGYGSNIMIARSSKGHINLSGIHDSSRNPSIEIK